MHSVAEIMDEAKRLHPEWSHTELASYVIGYFDAMLDAHMRKANGEE